MLVWHRRIFPPDDHGFGLRLVLGDLIFRGLHFGLPHGDDARVNRLLWPEKARRESAEMTRWRPEKTAKCLLSVWGSFVGGFGLKEETLCVLGVRVNESFEVILKVVDFQKRASETWHYIYQYQEGQWIQSNCMGRRGGLAFWTVKPLCPPGILTEVERF